MTDRYVSSVRNTLERVEENKWILKISMVLPNICLTNLDGIIEYIETWEKSKWDIEHSKRIKELINID